MAGGNLVRRLYFSLGFHAIPQDSFVYTLLQRAMNGVKRHLARRRRPTGHNVQVLQRDGGQGSALDVRHIVLIKGDQIGDLVVALPAIARLKSRFPHAAITLVCNPVNAALAHAYGLFDTVLTAPLDPRRAGTTTAERAEVEAILAAIPPCDLAIDMKIEASTRFSLTHVRARVKAGFHDGVYLQNGPDSIILPPIDYETNLHTSELLLMLTNAVISRFDRRSANSAIEGILRHAEAEIGHKLPVTSGQRLIGVNIGAGMTVKYWPVAHFTALCRAMQQQLGARIVFFGAASESAPTADIIAGLDAAQVLDLTGALSLAEFIGAAGQLDLFIGLDTGTTHIAAGLGVKTICLFPGVTIQSRWLPDGPALTVIYNDVSCRLCGIRQAEICPNGHVCMTGIAPERVMAEVVRIIG